LSLAITILLLIAIITIGFKIKEVVLINPVESLRYE